jgi:hypothetical protein
LQSSCKPSTPSFSSIPSITSLTKILVIMGISDPTRILDTHGYWPHSHKSPFFLWLAECPMNCPERKHIFGRGLHSLTKDSSLCTSPGLMSWKHAVGNSSLSICWVGVLINLGICYN